MRLLLKVIFMAFGTVLILYLILPSPDFPPPSQDALQSQEPGDTETPLRRAYFTNYTRAQVLAHYQNQFSASSFKGIPLPTYRLNYPPEDAYVFIRDQTRSTFLEEIVHPFRESLFVNGFEPKDPKDAIVIAEKPWRQKITVRYVESSYLIRIVIALGILVSIIVLSKEWLYAFNDFIKIRK